MNQPVSQPWGGLGKQEIEKLSPRSKEEFFKQSTGAQFVKRGLRVGAWGATETGKTYFAMTFPEPVFIIDTEFGAAPLLHMFPNKDIRIFECAQLDSITSEPDPLKSLTEVEAALSSLKDIDHGTLVIDSGTDIWQWISAWLETVATKRSESGQPYRFEWGKANSRYRMLLMRILARPQINFVITAQTQEKYDNSGKPTGITEPRWQDKTEYWMDIIVHFQKLYRGSWKYISTIEKCRFKRAANLEIEDVSYDKLVNALKEKLGVQI